MHGGIADPVMEPYCPLEALDFVFESQQIRDRTVGLRFLHRARRYRSGLICFVPGL